MYPGQISEIIDLNQGAYRLLLLTTPISYAKRSCLLNESSTLKLGKIYYQ